MKKEKLHSVITKVPSSLHRAMRMRAAKDDKKLADVFRAAIYGYLGVEERSA